MPVGWHRRSWGAVGGASSPRMDRGLAQAPPPDRQAATTVSRMRSAPQCLGRKAKAPAARTASADSSGLVGREDDHADGRVLLDDLLGGLEAVGGRHPQVHQDHVGWSEPTMATPLTPSGASPTTSMPASSSTPRMALRIAAASSTSSTRGPSLASPCRSCLWLSCSWVIGAWYPRERPFKPSFRA